MFNGSFAPVSLGANAFKRPALPPDWCRSTCRTSAATIYVTYAPAGRAGADRGHRGHGSGRGIRHQRQPHPARSSSGSKLASPWGITLAPGGFGRFGGDLLVGNFSFAASEINAFDPMTGALLGTIPIDVGGNSPGGLWDLTFGNGGAGGDPNTLYFTDGINGEADGLFGAILRSPSPQACCCWLRHWL